MHATQIKPQEPEGFILQRIHDLGFLSVQCDPHWDQLFLESLQGSFSPAPFLVVATDSNDDIIGEPMVVHCLVGSLTGDN